MKSFLTKLGSQPVVGLYIGDSEVALSRVVGTLVGPVEVSRDSQVYEQPDQLPQVLQGLLGQPLTEEKVLGPPVALGLCLERVFYSTRPIRTDNSSASPQVLLHEALQSTTAVTEEMVVEVIRSRPGQRKVASIAACRKKYLLDLLKEVQQRGCRPGRAEPAPCALLRAAMTRHPAPRRARNVVRVFLGARQGLAVAVSANLPLVWRSFPLEAASLETIPGSISSESLAVRSVIRTLQTLIVHCGVEPTVDGILIHGRPDLHEQLTRDLAEDLTGRGQFFDGPDFSAGSIAYGLALGGLRGQSSLTQWGDGFDLAHSLKPPDRIRDLIPWQQLAINVGLLILWALVLLFRMHSVERDYRAIRAEVLSAPGDLGQASETQLRQARQELSGKIEAIRTFLATRALWTAHTHDVATRLPVGATLVSLQGNCELDDTSARKGAGARGKKGLILKAVAPIAPGGSVPREVDNFLTSLRAAPNLQRDFPLVELADIRWFQPGRGEQPMATFTIACLPRVSPTDLARKAAAAKDRAAGKGRR